jgi:hypothetical protein
MALQICGQILQRVTNVDLSGSGRFKSDGRKLVLRTICKKEGWGYRKRLLQQNILQAQDRVKVTVGSPESAFHALRRVGTHARERDWMGFIAMCGLHNKKQYKQGREKS